MCRPLLLSPGTMGLMSKPRYIGHWSSTTLVLFFFPCAGDKHTDPCRVQNHGRRRCSVHFRLARLVGRSQLPGQRRGRSGGCHSGLHRYHSLQQLLHQPRQGDALGGASQGHLGCQHESHRRLQPFRTQPCPTHAKVGTLVNPTHTRIPPAPTLLPQQLVI